MPRIHRLDVLNVIIVHINVYVDTISGTDEHDGDQYRDLCTVLEDVRLLSEVDPDVNEEDLRAMIRDVVAMNSGK